MSSFIFGNRVAAHFNGQCINRSLQELWHGFGFRCTEVDFTPITEMAFRIGNIEPPVLGNDETFACRITEEGVYLVGADKNSLIRGFLALIQEIKPIDLDKGGERFSLECGEIRDSFEIKVRMVHLCVFPESDLNFLKKTIRYCGVLGYSHIILEFWGMLQYDCLKELAWPQAYSKEQAKTLIDEIRYLGMEPVPMFNMLGHAAGARMTSGKHVVLDQNPRLQPLFLEDGWVWNFQNPKTVELIRTIRKELYQLFGEGEYIHIGCDEAYECGGNFDLSDDFCTYLTALTSEIIEQENRRPIMWGDMLLSSEGCGLESSPGNGYEFWCSDGRIAAKLLENLNRRVILADWQYSVTAAPVLTTLYLQRCGFDVITCPYSEVENVKACAQTVKEHHGFGIMDTTWHTLKDCYHALYACALLCGSKPVETAPLQWVRRCGEISYLVRRLACEYRGYSETGWWKKQIE